MVILLICYMLGSEIKKSHFTLRSLIFGRQKQYLTASEPDLCGIKIEQSTLYNVL